MAKPFHVFANVKDTVIFGYRQQYLQVTGQNPHSCGPRACLRPVYLPSFFSRRAPPPPGQLVGVGFAGAIQPNMCELMGNNVVWLRL